jgi:serine/threonine-protein phosphatase 5
MVRLFAQLPLAALVEGSTLIMHGGLFRAPPEHKQDEPKFKNLNDLPVGHKLRLGTLQDLAKASKGGADPDAECEWLHAEPRRHPAGRMHVLHAAAAHG